jgi:peptide deformylase
MDHLDGKLIIDNMSPADEIVNRRAIKQLKEQFQPVRSTR